MPIRVYYEVLNQKGTPALYSDNYAQRPAAGYQGRIFNSPDTGQIFYDTGTTWTLLADAGVGSGSLASVCANGNTTATGITITAGGLSANSVTATGLPQGSVVFAAAGGTLAQNNTNFFWDNSTFRLGINTNTPSVNLDVHGTTGVLVQLNNTTTADSKIAFLNADVGKWRIGNLYNAGANSFHIYNNTLATTPLVITNNDTFFFNGTNQYVFAGPILANLSIAYKENVGTTTSSGYTTFNAFSSGITNTLTIVYSTSNQANLVFTNNANYTYTYPSATGTLALTSNLGGTTGYLPKYASGTSLGQSLFYDNGTAAYIGATSGGNALFNAIATTGFAIDAAGYFMVRGDIGVGTPRQLNILCTGGNEVYFNTSGYGASYSTLMVFQTTNGASVNTNQLVLNQYGGIGMGTTTIRNVSGYNFVSINGTTKGGYLDVYYNGTLTGAFGAETNGLNITSTISGSSIIFNVNNGGTFINPLTIRADGNVGVGDSGNPSVRLVVQGASSSSGDYAFISYNSSSTALFALRNDGAIRLNTFTYNNTVTVGVRTLYIDNTNALGGISSIRESKKNINNITNVDWLYQLNPVTFNYRKKDSNGNYLEEYYDDINYGLIAEDTKNVADFLCNYDDNKLKGIEYSRLITPLLVSAISHEERIKALEQKLN